MSGKFIPGIYHINYTVMKNIIGSGFLTEIYECMGMIFKNIEYLNGGGVKISVVPKSVGRAPPPLPLGSKSSGKASHHI
jgi:hypothetical protein